MKRTKAVKLSGQIKRKVGKPITHQPTFDGTTEAIISTGSTLLDLAISGGRVRGGGIVGGILVEIFGPESSGKSVLICEMAGAVQRQEGQVMFGDPEGRLDKQFAKIFGFDADKTNYTRPDYIPEVFKAVRDWRPKPAGKIHGIFADSLAALSTDLEMSNEEGDKYGGRRAKEFSQELRKTCRVLANKNYLMVCSNQIRENIGVTFGAKFDSTGGRALRHYPSLRIRTSIHKKLVKEKTFKGTEIKRVVGVEIGAEIVKNSTWVPFRTAPLTILFDYGIDDIRQNLQYVKTHNRNSTYTIGGKSLSNKMEDAIRLIEQDKLEQQLREEVINCWEYIEDKFKSNRKTKIR